MMSVVVLKDFFSIRGGANVAPDSSAADGVAGVSGQTFTFDQHNPYSLVAFTMLAFVFLLFGYLLYDAVYKGGDKT